MKKVYLLSLSFLLAFSSYSQYATDSFSFGGTMRKYLLYIPTSYTGTHAVPFVMVLHGLGDDINNFKDIRFEDVADTANFIFAIPQALVDPLSQATAWNSGAGNFGVTLNANVDDVGFLNALIDTVAAHYMLDQARLFSTGFSMGGFMSNRLACELNSRIAAIASVSGTIGNGITCHPTRAIPVAHFHGTSDQVVLYHNNLYGNDPEALVAYWAAHDHCDSIPSSIDTLPHISTDNLQIVHYVYPHGNYGTDVEFWKVINGTHEWLGPTGHDINYTVAIWDFFNKYKWLPQVTGIDGLADNASVKIYPNPASSHIDIDLFDIGFTHSVIEIRDISGRLLYSKISDEMAISIDTKEFERGMYIVQVTNGGTRTSKKICLL